MNILEQYKDRINGTFSFFDRIIIKGYITRFFTITGSGSYASQCGVRLMDFSAYAQKQTEDLKKYVEKYTADSGRPLIYLRSSKECKEDIARRILEEKPIEEGLICTISVVEECFSLEPVKNKNNGMLEIRRTKRKCLHYYFYMLDKYFGFMFFRLQTWFPFDVTIYINGREMMKHILDESAIEYTMYDNSFSSISDIAKAQGLADKLADNAKNLSGKFDYLARKFNPYLETLIKLNGEGYRWYLSQCEYATDIMFKSRESLEDIYPSLVDQAFYDFNCTDVFTFLGRKLTSKFNGEAVTDYKKRPIGWRVKFKLNSNHIKFYDKSNCLRVETTINNPYEFKVFKEVHHKDGSISKQWVPMGKALSNLYRYAQIGKECNNRLIQAMQNIVPVTSVLNQIERVSVRKIVNERSVPALNVWSPNDYHLFTVIADGAFLIHGFQNSDIRDILYPEVEDEKKRSAKTSRTLSKLRKHKIIRKIPHSSRYLLTNEGRQITGAVLHIRNHMYPEAAAEFSN